MSEFFFNKALFSTYPFLSIGRLTYLTVCTFTGLFMSFTSSAMEWLTIGGFLGFAVGCCVLWLETHLTSCSRSTIFCGSLGLMIGMMGTCLLLLAWSLGLLGHSSVHPWAIAFSLLLFPYLGLTLGLYFSQPESQVSSLNPYQSSSRPPLQNVTIHSVPKVLDSSAIIDGRVLYLCRTGFLEGPLLVPELVLREIHLIADSDDPSKRTKGKRGLEILNDLQQLSQPEVVIVNDRHSQDLAVDHQLIAIAKDRQAKIVTNDWNLAKVANVQEVTALNVNELTYHLRPLVLPGEIIRVFVQKEGQGLGQGVAHLDDGTMVVIDHGAPAIGRVLDVEVSRYMQTTTGRMIFAFPTHLDHCPPSNRPSVSQPLFSGLVLTTVQRK